MPALGAGAGGVGGQVAAGLGNGTHVGHLAVPSSWPEHRPRRPRRVPLRSSSVSPWPLAIPGPETWWAACPRAWAVPGVAQAPLPDTGSNPSSWPAQCRPGNQTFHTARPARLLFGPARRALPFTIEKQVARRTRALALGVSASIRAVVATLRAFRRVEVR